MITIAILGLLAAIAQPSIRSLLEREREDTIFHTLVDAIREGRGAARRSMRDVTIILSPSHLSVSSSVFQRDIELNPSYASVILSTGSDRFEFEEDGSLEQPEPLVITLRESTGTIRTITVYPATGAVRDTSGAQ